MTTETARESLFRKIRALLAKTTEAGCTEEEAMSAASLARRLMDDYNIAHDDLNEPDPWADLHFSCQSPGTKRARKRAWSLRQTIATTIGLYCDCRTLHNPDAGTFKFFGREGDVMFAGWLLESLDAFGIRAWNLFDAAQAIGDDPYTADRESFLLAYAARIKERLNEATKARLEPTTTGSGLIVRRNDARDLEYYKRNPGITKFHANAGRMADPASYAAGQSAASRASFHKPMNGRAGPLMITR